MKQKTCTIKELYDYFKKIGKENYELYFECLTVYGETEHIEINLQNITINDEEKKIIL